MDLSGVTGETDSFEFLCKKIQALGALNQETLDIIESRKCDEVTAGYEYTLDCNLPQISLVESGQNETFWSVLTKKKTHHVGALLQSWKYNGESLEAEPLFGLDVDLTLLQYGDICRLVGSFVELGKKYSKFLSDGPETRVALRIVLSNMERIQVALGQLHQMTLDVEDSVGNNAKLKNAMSKILEGFEELTGVIPTASIQVSGRYSKKVHSTDELATICDLSKLSCKRNLTHPSIGRAVRSFIMKEHPIIASGGDGNMVKIWDMGNANKKVVVPMIGHVEDVYSLAVYESYGIKYLACGCKDGTISLWNLSDGDLKASLKGHTEAVWTLKTYQENDGRLTLVSGSDDKTVKLWNLDNHSLNATLNDTGCVYAIEVFKQAGKTYLVTGGSEMTVNIWCLSNDNLLSSFTGHSGMILSVSVMDFDDQMIIASGSSDHTIRLWKIGENESIACFEDHSDTVRALTSVCYREKLCLVSGSYDKSIKIWDLDTKKVLKTLTGHTFEIMSLSTFQENGCGCLVSIDFIGNIKIWRE